MSNARPNSLPITLVIVFCAVGSAAALWLGGDVISFLRSAANSRVINPVGTVKLIGLSALWLLLGAALAVVTFKVHSAQSSQRALGSSWSIASICLWGSMVAIMYGIYYPLPPENAHVDKLLLLAAVLCVWTALLVVHPPWLGRFLEGRLYRGLRLVMLNVVVFALIGEATLRLADPLLGRHGPFGHAMTPAHMKPFAPTSGSIRMTNSQGFRDRERSLERVGIAPRVVALGDSFTYGGWGPYDDMFITLLEHALDTWHPGSEVINLGVPGWEPSQEVHLLKVYGVRLAPDTVMLNVFVQNDIMYKRTYEMQEAVLVGGQSYYVHSNGHWLHDTIGPDRWFLYHNVNYLIRVSANRFIADVGPKEFTHPELKSSPFGSRGEYIGYIADRAEIYLREDTALFHFHWDRTQRILQDLREYVGARRMKLLLVLIPAHEQVDHGVQQELLDFLREDHARYDFVKPQRLLRQWCEEHGVAYVDLLPAFEGAPVPSSLYYPNDIHWSLAGHRLAAWTIYPMLVRELMTLRS